jgi:predicted nucleotidyltransferase
VGELLKLREGMKIQKRYQEPVREFVKVALEKYEDKIEGIILFGSVARGKAKEDSDIDVLVVGDVSLEELVDISFPILLEYGELISAKDMEKDHFEFLAREEYSFVRNVLRDGVVLYERMGEAFGES